MDSIRHFLYPTGRRSMKQASRGIGDNTLLPFLVVQLHHPLGMQTIDEANTSAKRPSDSVHLLLWNTNILNRTFVR